MRLRKKVNPRSTQNIGAMWWRDPRVPSNPWLLSQYYTNSMHLTGQTYGWPYYSLESCLDELHPGPPFQKGGPFYKWGSASSFPTATGVGTYLTKWGVDREFRYEGGFCSGIPVEVGWFSGGAHTCRSWPITMTTAQMAASTWGSVDAYGAKAWTKFRPGESLADAAVFIGEITDVPRMLKTTASLFGREFLSRFGRNPRGYAKNAADHWLNTQFGWLPFISDLRKFYRAWKVMDTWYNNLVRNNGQWVKRGGIVKKDTSVTEVASYGSALITPALLNFTYWNPNYPDKGKSRITRVTSQKAWFEARYRYYVPEIESVVWKRKALLHLFGVDLNPATVWELIPWSWLIDWFANVGDLLNAKSNTSLFNNLATEAAYMMGTTEELVRHDAHFNFLGGPMHLTWETNLVRKVRKLGGKFGFDLSDASITARQWSILGALGISRFS